MVNYYEEEDEGCCLICQNGYDGCLCYECKCTKCDKYNSSGHCNLAESFKEKAEDNYQWLCSNIQVIFKVNDEIQVKITGPVIKANYAKIKPFLQTYFRYNHEEKCYETYSVNPRFISWLRETLEQAGFTPEEITEEH